MEGWRHITPEDFRETRVIKAMFLGRSQYLTTGESYNVQYMERRNTVSVPLRSNPHIGRSNSGVEFSLKNFYVEENKQS